MRVLTRASDLARLQGVLVKRSIEAANPGSDVVLLSRDSAGDRDGATPLWQLGDKGAFTADLSDALSRGDADIVVHSWKDLPIEPRRDTRVVATLPRADARDVLLVRKDAAARQPAWLKILTSSPRRALMLGESLPGLLPWRVDAIECVTVRGNVPTRVRRLQEGAGDALVVAKAALDRLLDPVSPFVNAAQAIRSALETMQWMVLPLREFPSAAAQGALAIEVAAAANGPLMDLLERLNDRRTCRAVTAERQLLAAHGGGCHQAIGATVQTFGFGDVVSVRGRSERGEAVERWALESNRPKQPRAAVSAIWPRPEERDRVTRTQIDIDDPSDDRGLYVTRNEALPSAWRIAADRIVWAAGASTWRRLAARGIWVHGSSEGLGQFDASAIDRLAQRAMSWHRLTHKGADVAHALPTYEADSCLPRDLDARTHFFWRSGSEFRQALAAFPQVRDRWHACGPGHTLEVVDGIAGATRVRPFLEYADWRAEVTA